MKHLGKRTPVSKWWCDPLHLTLAPLFKVFPLPKIAFTIIPSSRANMLRFTKAHCPSEVSPPFQFKSGPLHQNHNKSQEQKQRGTPARGARDACLSDGPNLICVSKKLSLARAAELREPPSWSARGSGKPGTSAWSMHCVYVRLEWRRQHERLSRVESCVARHCS